MIMFEGKTTPKEIIDLMLKEIVRLGGLEKAFPHEGRIQLYTGPNGEYLLKPPIGTSPVIGPEIRNSDRAEEQAKEWDAVRLNDTPIGKFLFETNKLYDWFNQIHTDPITGRIREDRVQQDTKAITAFASALFIRTASGDVQTCVCGGERYRVFCETEMHGMCEQSHLVTPSKLGAIRLNLIRKYNSVRKQPNEHFPSKRKNSLESTTRSQKGL